MAKKDKSVVDEGDAGEVTPPVADETASESETFVQGEIHSQAQAEAEAKSGRYTFPPEVAIVYVTQDGNVFFPSSANAAMNHAQRNNLKIFTVACQD